MFHHSGKFVNNLFCAGRSTLGDILYNVLTKRRQNRVNLRDICGQHQVKTLAGYLQHF
jgi:hypothetical protein